MKKEKWRVCKQCGRYYYVEHIVECKLCLDLSSNTPVLGDQENFTVIWMSVEEVVEILCNGGELGGTIRPGKFDPYLERLREANILKEPAL